MGEEKTAKAALGKNFFFDVLRATIVSLVVSLLLLVAFTFVVEYSALAEKGIAIGNVSIKLVSVLLGALIGIKHGRLGFFKGIIAGTVFVLCSFLIAAAVNGSFKMESGINWLDWLCGIVMGGFSGVLAASVKGKK